MPPTRSSAKTCLLIIDMINEFTFDGAPKLFPAIEETARTIAALKRRMKRTRLPVVYVNDNFGKWQSDFRKLVARCLEEQCRGKQIAQILLPEDDDYFVLKPKHSGFFDTTLDTLLETLRIRRVILTGIAGNICVLFTANDAYMREYKIFAPADCIVSNTAADNDHALRQIRTVLKGNVTASTRLRFQSNHRSRTAKHR